MQGMVCGLQATRTRKIWIDVWQTCDRLHGDRWRIRIVPGIRHPIPAYETKGKASRVGPKNGEGPVNFRAAVDEFANLLTVGSSALERLAHREPRYSRSHEVIELMAETRRIADRLKVIAEGVKRLPE